MKFKIVSALALMFCSTGAFAQAGAPQAPGISQLLILGVFVAFFFWMMRSQSKKTKDHQNMIQSIAKGDEVLTNGGIIGKVTKVADAVFVIQLTEGIEVLVQKNMVAASLPKGTMKSV